MLCFSQDRVASFLVMQLIDLIKFLIKNISILIELNICNYI